MVIFRAVGFAMPLLLLASLPAAAFEITDLQPPPPDLPLTVTALPAELPEAPGPPVPKRLELALFDRVGLTRKTTEQMRHEVEEIFSSLGTEIGWPDPGAVPAVAAGSTRIQIILIPSAPRAWRLEEGTMGAVFRSEAPVERTYVFPVAVMRALGGRRDDLFYNRRLARALGRVIGHEVIHAIAPDHPHVAEGLMRERQNRFWLLRSELSVDPLCAEAFLAHLQSDSRQSQQAAAASRGIPVRSSSAVG